MTTPKPVSPAPDTEALRQQVEEALKERWLDDESERGRATPEGLADAVLSLPWIKYAAGQRHVVTMHEQNNAAIAKTNREFAEENAGLRADLDRARADALAWERAARAEVDSARIQIDLLSRMLRGMARRAVSYRQGWSKTLKDWADEDQETVAALRARVSGALPIPDDAAAVDRLAVWLLRAMGGNIVDGPGDAAAWQDAFENGLTDNQRATWRAAARALLADLGATPTTGPAPAAAASTDEEWAVWYGGPDPYNAAGIESYDDEDDARENLQWYRSDLGSGIAVRTVTRSTWQVVPATPQAPAEPTASAKLFNRLIAGASLVNGVPQTPAAREDAATPDVPMAECGYHTAAWAPFSIQHELCGTPYARGEDTNEDDEYGDDLIVPNLAKPAKEA